MGIPRLNEKLFSENSRNIRKEKGSKVLQYHLTVELIQGLNPKATPKLKKLRAIKSSLIRKISGTKSRMYAADWQNMKFYVVHSSGVVHPLWLTQLSLNEGDKLEDVLASFLARCGKNIRLLIPVGNEEYIRVGVRGYSDKNAPRAYKKPREISGDYLRFIAFGAWCDMDLVNSLSKREQKILDRELERFQAKSPEMAHLVNTFLRPSSYKGTLQTTGIPANIAGMIFPRSTALMKVKLQKFNQQKEDQQKRNEQERLEKEREIQEYKKELKQSQERLEKEKESLQEVVDYFYSMPPSFRKEMEKLLKQELKKGCNSRTNSALRRAVELGLIRL